MRTVQGIKIVTITNVRHAHSRQGGYFFTRGSLICWKTEVHAQLFANRFFVTSDVKESNGPRTYSVRELTDSGRINAVNGYQDFASLREAVGKAFDLGILRGSEDLAA